MIEIIENKNFFNVDAEGLVCTTNTKGIQGKGIALEFKKRFPNNYLAYKKYCDSGSAKPGTIFTFIRNENPKYIFNFMTKNHWKYPSKLEWIDSGLEQLKEMVDEYKIKSLNIPALGCSNGKLNFSDVKPLIISYFKNSECLVNIFPPH